jgi:F-type H+-transporting ATPase subunit b
MDLITPAFGLIFWQTLIFLAVLFVLGKFAWKPILGALKSREDSIDEALKSAVMAKEEMASLKSDNEKLLNEAKEERNMMLKDAAKLAAEMKDQAMEDAKVVGEKMIEEARLTIDSEKNDALRQIKDQVAELSLQITEKLLKKNLADDKNQQELIKGYMKDIKLN